MAPDQLVVAKTVDTIVPFREVCIYISLLGCGIHFTFHKGHSQKEHDTSHGSMSRVKWSVEGSDEAALEVSGHKFATNDDGAPMMCNLYCADLGRHVHVDYCRSADAAPCSGTEIQHISARVQPNPERTKDWITHSLHWKRMGVSVFPRWYPHKLTSLQDSKACQRTGGSRVANRLQIHTPRTIKPNLRNG